jgi:hypothetical protein
MTELLWVPGEEESAGAALLEVGGGPGEDS